MQERLKQGMLHVLHEFGDPSPNSVCHRVHMEVERALDAARGMQGVHAITGQMPPHIALEVRTDPAECAAA